MKINILDNSTELGKHAAKKIARIVNNAISKRGVAYLLLSTGASQFTTLEALLEQPIDWSKVEMFHLDEYIGITKEHSASFVRYLEDRFVSKLNLKAVHYVDTSIGAEAIIERLTSILDVVEIDCGVIGIGENGHIAFNDPPADFTTTASFKVVTLDEACRNQQFGEGWFPTFDDVPTHAVTMTVSQILKCKAIITSVPYSVKAPAVKNTFLKPISPDFPSTILRTHDNLHLFLDKDSASLLDANDLEEFIWN